MNILKPKPLLFFFLGLVTFLVVSATIQPNNGTGISVNGGTGKTNTFYGATNYYAGSDLAANTNGPTVFYRTPGGGGISNLWIETTLGTVSRGLMVWSQTAGDGGAYGGFFMNGDHDGSPPQPNNAELQINSGAEISLLCGVANPHAGHIQFGPLSTSYNGYGGYNTWMDFLSPYFSLTQLIATNFSPAAVFQTAMLQGANTVAFYPAILSYGIRTNAPGRASLLITSDYGGAGGQLWDANTAKASRLAEFQFGDTNVMIVQSNLYVGGNLALKTPTTATALVNLGLDSNGFVSSNATPVMGSILTNFLATSAGTVYTLTASYALLDFGTTDPTITIQNTGNYLLWGGANFTSRGATYAATNTYSIKLRKTSGTPADVASSEAVQTIPIITTVTEDLGWIQTRPVIFSATAGDVVQLWGVLSATPSAGNVICDRADVTCFRLY